MAPIESTARGELWVGRDRRRGRDVVVKVVPGAAADRVEAEARSLARLGDHPHVLVPVAVGRGPDVAWVVTDHVAGGTLWEASRGAPAGVVVAWLAQVASALARAHDLGVAHGDVTPTNVLVERGAGNGAGRAVLADFGSALLAEPERTDAPPGGHTPRWAAPERRRGGPPTAAGDVYGLGATGTAALAVAGGRAPWPARRLLRRCAATRPARRPTAQTVARRLGRWSGRGAGR